MCSVILIVLLRDPDRFHVPPNDGLSAERLNSVDSFGGGGGGQGSSYELSAYGPSFAPPRPPEGAYYYPPSDGYVEKRRPSAASAYGPPERAYSSWDADAVPYSQPARYGAPPQAGYGYGAPPYGQPVGYYGAPPNGPQAGYYV